MKNITSQFGSLSIEFLVALAVTATVLTASARIVFGLQDAVVIRDITTEAQDIAKEDAALVRMQSGPLQSIPPMATASNDFAVERVLRVSTLCTATAITRVSRSIPRAATTELATTVTSSQSLTDSGLDCPAIGLTGQWTSPRSVGAISLGLARIQIHGVDVVNRNSARLAVAVGTSTQPADPDLFVVDATNAASPLVLSSIHTGGGLFAVDVAGSYAYVVHNSSSLQFQVIDLTAPAHPVLVASRSLPSASGSFPEGRSIFIFRNRAYIGTYETAGSEFYIFDISNPLSPVFLGSKAVNHSVRTIVVREESVGTTLKLLAYIASSANAAELQVLDVTDPAHILDFSVFDAQGSGSATALFATGKVMWIARQQVVGEPTVVAVSVAEPLHPTLLSSYNAKLKSGSVVNGFVVSNVTLVMTTSDTASPFLVCAITDAYAITSCSAGTVISNSGRIDYQDNLTFMPNGNSLAIVGN